MNSKEVTALVLSCLDHCNAVLAGLPAMTLGPSTESRACSSMHCSRLKVPRPCHSCFAITERIAYTTSCSCLSTRCSSGMLSITFPLPACWRPPLTFLHGRRCVHRVTVTWSYQERVGRLLTGLSPVDRQPIPSTECGNRERLSLLPHSMLGIGCRPTWNSHVWLHHSGANLEFSVSCCLHWRE